MDRWGRIGDYEVDEEAYHHSIKLSISHINWCQGEDWEWKGSKEATIWSVHYVEWAWSGAHKNTDSANIIVRLKTNPP